MEKPLILASRSPRRKDLLQKLGISIEIIPSDVREDFRGGEPPRDHVLRLASGKAEWVAARFPNRWVLGADTVVVVDGLVLGKAETSEEARCMLARLSGRDHQVLTGYAIFHMSHGIFWKEAMETTVKFKSLDSHEIDWYIQTGESFGKAGGYAIQGVGCFMVEEIHGSYSNVVGLPVCQVVRSLRALGALDLGAVCNREDR